MITEFMDTDFLRDGEIFLKCTEQNPGDPAKNWVPAYHFAICAPDGTEMGKCDLRLGHSQRLYYGGHIGYRVEEPYRGHHFAGKAVKLLLELAKRHELGHLYITCDPSNAASYKTCVWAGGRFIETVELPEDNDMRVEDGKTHVCVFRWDIENGRTEKR